ncbi:MAG TPA: hypothetical protein PKE13_08350 [Hyphomicrobium zavarzinii]|nr:hypothetical protein [Hyphomicrobium zavarzinii]
MTRTVLGWADAKQSPPAGSWSIPCSRCALGQDPAVAIAKALGVQFTKVP